MSNTRGRAFAANVVKHNRSTINNEKHIVDRTEEIKLISCSIYNNKPELIHHCKDVINMVTPSGTSIHEKAVYLKRALFMSEYFKNKDVYDIGRINKYIQHEVSTALINREEELYTFILED